MSNKLLAFVALSALSGCTPPEAATVAPLDVDFSWVGTARCITVPPAFKIGGVPSSTKTLDFTFRVGAPPGSPQGGGHVAYNGSGLIPAGSFYYLGPCPVGVQSYSFVVQALDESGTVVARGQAMRPFPP